MKEPRTEDEAQRWAARLVADLHSLDPKKHGPARDRFMAWPGSGGLSDAVLRDADALLPHALSVVAHAAGLDDWPSLQARLAKRAALRARRAPTAFYPSFAAAYTHHWFADHASAVSHRASNGGYLLPFRDHFFVASAEYIRALGLDPDDADWTRLGHDAARPADGEALRRLLEQRRQAEALEALDRDRAEPRFSGLPGLDGGV